MDFVHAGKALFTDLSLRQHCSELKGDTGDVSKNSRFGVNPLPEQFSQV